MKSIPEIFNQEPVFLHNWANKFGVVADFENVYMSEKEFNAEKSPYPNEEAWRENKANMAIALEKYKGEKILFASYGTDNYSGEAWVLFEKDGELFEVNGSHCSCMGLEGQWSPEPVVLSELENRMKKGYFGRDSYADNYFVDELAKFLGVELSTIQAE